MSHCEFIQVEDEYFLFEHVQLRQSDIDGHEIHFDVVRKFEIVDHRIVQTVQRDSVAFLGELRQGNEKPKQTSNFSNRSFTNSRIRRDYSSF